jgi:hypothetical protein
MINTSNVSLSQARGDCGISANGGLHNVTEFIDRHRDSDYSLLDLAGHVACFSSKQTTGSYSRNYNPGSACRKNWAEANVFSENNSHSITLSNSSGKHCAEGSNSSSTRDVLGGYSYVGTIPPGVGNYEYGAEYRVPLSGTTVSVEVIGWSDGYFAGTPEYYVSFTTGSDNSGAPFPFQMNGSTHPYVTLCLQCRGAGKVSSRIEISAAYIKAT